MSLPIDDNTPFGEESSGIYYSTFATSDFITEAFDLCQMGVEGEDISSEMFERGLRSLNLMLQTWQAQGMHLWTFTEGTLFLEGGKNSYILEQSIATERYYYTATTQDATAGDTTLFINPEFNQYNVQTNEDVIEGWYVGLLDSSNEIFWAFVQDYDDVAGELVLMDEEENPAQIPNDAQEGSCVFLFKEIIQPVSRVLNVRRTDNLVNDTPINMISRQEYFDLPLKTSQGAAAEAYYDRDLPQGILYLWPEPQNGRTLIRFRYERLMQQFDSPNDCADFPQYWYEAITANLAKRLLIKYRVPTEIANEIRAYADETLTQALTFDEEVTDLKISLNRESR